MLPQEVLCRSGPFGQFDVFNLLAVGSGAQVKVLGVEQDVDALRHEELWDELLHVGRCGEAAYPLLLDSFEQAVWVVELPRLELNHPMRMTSDMKADDITRAAIVCAV